MTWWIFITSRQSNRQPVGSFHALKCQGEKSTRLTHSSQVTPHHTRCDLLLLCYIFKNWSAFAWVPVPIPTPGTGRPYPHPTADRIRPPNPTASLLYIPSPPRLRFVVLRTSVAPPPSLPPAPALGFWWVRRFSSRGLALTASRIACGVWCGLCSRSACFRAFLHVIRFHPIYSRDFQVVLCFFFRKKGVQFCWDGRDSPGFEVFVRPVSSSSAVLILDQSDLASIY
jgi:hypothetical protein